MGGPHPRQVRQSPTELQLTLILKDMSVLVGCPRISSNIPDPDANALLPVDDDEWDQGVSVTTKLH